MVYSFIPFSNNKPLQAVSVANFMVLSGILYFDLIKLVVNKSKM